MNTLFSTFYSFDPLIPGITKFSPKKLVLLIGKKNLEKEKVKEDLKKVKNLFGKVMEIRVVSLDCDTILQIAKDTVSELEKQDETIIMNFSGGSKFFAFGVCYGCYARAEKVKKMVCTNLDNNEIEEIPKLSYQISKKKKMVLEAISRRKRNESIHGIAKEKLGKSKTIVYQHLKELKEDGFIDDEFNITEAGRLALL